ncbi:hypothetical protein H6P81_007275 [Aristolochia fimbriata]|uniref:Uncharacterized protein n=1 Tax=Aristolochia fimbriata TaxID=158543 RepID=A0AAV7F0X4_ARIFI|nr:hypothetical protein H6P81_007275 [Aristolochia fimbriata]
MSRRCANNRIEFAGPTVRARVILQSAPRCCPSFCPQPWPPRGSETRTRAPRTVRISVTRRPRGIRDRRHRRPANAASNAEFASQARCSARPVSVFRKPRHPPFHDVIQTSGVRGSSDPYLKQILKATGNSPGFGFELFLLARWDRRARTAWSLSATSKAGKPFSLLRVERATVLCGRPRGHPVWLLSGSVPPDTMTEASGGSSGGWALWSGPRLNALLQGLAPRVSSLRCSDPGV